MQWSDALTTIRTICARLDEASVSAFYVIPEELYLLNPLSVVSLNYLDLLFVYRAHPMTEHEQERLYHTLAYQRPTQLALVQATIYLTSDLQRVIFNPVEVAHRSEWAIEYSSARLIWRPGLAWRSVLAKLMGGLEAALVGDRLVRQPLTSGVAGG